MACAFRGVAVVWIGLHCLPAFDNRAVLPPTISGRVAVVLTNAVPCLAPSFRPAEQFWSTEAMGMGLFYTLNVFIMQFYLGERQAVCHGMRPCGSMDMLQARHPTAGLA